MTQSTELALHVIEPTKPSIGSVIWMHGLGSDFHDFDSLIPNICDTTTHPLRFIFPNAPVRPVTFNNHIPMRAWYDVYSLSDLNQEDKNGIITSQSAISQLVDMEIARGTSPDRIVLAGFSQGGAMALYTGMRQQHKIGGILALSCYLPLMEEHAESNLSPRNFNTPIFMAHGTHDKTLPCFAGKMSYEKIHHTHSHANWHEYTMDHEITASEIHDIRQWLLQIYD